MAAPQPKAPFGSFADFCLWVIARLEADPKTAQHAALVQAPYDALDAKVKERNTATNAVLKAAAKRDYTRDTILDTLEPLQLSVSAYYKAKNHPGVARIFVRTPAQYAALARRDLLPELQKMEAALKDPETPKDVAKAAAEFLADLPNLVAATQALDKARLGLKKSIEGVDKAKIACLEANSKLRGRLQDQFPRQPKVVARYFPPVKAGEGGAVGEVVPLNAPNEAPK